jgi:predicted permease
MELAMPCGAVVVAVAAETKSDAQQATDNMIYSTVLCLFTLPLFMVLLNYI